MIPIHVEELSARETLRIDRTLGNVAPSSMFFVGPEGLDLRAYRSRWPSVAFEGFHADRFASIAAYNEWMLTPELYRRFSWSEFILVHQTDAVLIRPLPADAEWAFDYLGAPWDPPQMVGWNVRRRRLVRSGPSLLKRRLEVGNGGLSLRRTAAFVEGLRLPRFRKLPNEDVAISYFHRRLGVRLAPSAVASRFFMETGSSRWKSGDPIPDVHGFHALDKWNPALEDAILDGARPA